LGIQNLSLQPNYP